METIESKFANAYLSLAIEKNNIDEVVSSNKVLLELLSDEELQKTLESEFISKGEKEKLLKQIFPFLSEDYLNFLFVINDYHCMKYLPKIIKRLDILVNNYINVSHGVVYSYDALSENEISKLEKQLTLKYHYQVHLKNIIDKTLLGGIKIVVNNQELDYSLLKKFNGLKQSLKGETE